MKPIHSAFTLVEVSVAGSLIGLCVLTAVAIIPQGMAAQDQARMRAAAAGAIMTLSERGKTGGTSLGYNVFSRLTSTTTPSNLLTTIPIKAWDSNGAVTTVPSAIYQPISLPVEGDLSRRLIYSVDGGGPRAITVWMLSRDPTNPAEKRATYLTTFVEAD
jgi:hypothetical protein